MTTMTKIILLIIAFQVVMGILAKRKARKQAEEEARNPAEAMDGNSLPAPATKRIPSWTSSEGGDDEEEDEWDEHHRRGEIERARPLPVPNQRHEAPRHATGSGKAGAGKEKAKELGKDLLSQLAKELGLELPQDKAPAPRPKPVAHPQPPAAPKQPAGNPKGVPVARTAAARPTAQAQKAINQAQRMASDATRDARISAARGHHVDGDHLPRRDHRNLYATEAPMAVPAVESPRDVLFDTESLRRAFILKTILDKPLSLKMRHPGED